MKLLFGSEWDLFAFSAVRQGGISSGEGNELLEPLIQTCCHLLDPGAPCFGGIKTFYSLGIVCRCKVRRRAGAAS